MKGLHLFFFLFSVGGCFKGMCLTSANTTAISLLWKNMSPVSQPFKGDILTITLSTCQLKTACGHGPTKESLFFAFNSSTLFDMYSA